MPSVRLQSGVLVSEEMENFYKNNEIIIIAHALDINPH